MNDIKKYLKIPMVKLFVTFSMIIFLSCGVWFAYDFFENEDVKVSEIFKKGIDSSVRNPKENRIVVGGKDITDEYIDRIKSLQVKGDYDAIYELLGLNVENPPSLSLKIDE